MAFTLFAETDLIFNTMTSVKVELYIDDANPPSFRKIITTGDYTLTRGKSSPTDKFDYIKPTNIKINVADENNFLVDLMSGENDLKFIAKVYELGTLSFTGLVSLVQTKYNFDGYLQVVQLNIYDGLSRLKEMTDLSAFTQGKKTLNFITRTILNYLQLNLNIATICNIYPSDNNSLPCKTFDVIGLNVKDLLLINEDLSYYDILEYICRHLGMMLYQEIYGWCFVQVESIQASNMNLHRFSYSDGSSINNVLIGFDVDCDESQWAYQPKRFLIKGFENVVSTVAIPSEETVASQYSEELNYLDWINGTFVDGVTGWSGTYSEIKNNSVVVSPGNTIEQSTDNLSSGDEIEIYYSGTIIRYMSAISDGINADMISIVAIEQGGDEAVLYYHFTNQIWQTLETSLSFYLVPDKYPFVFGAYIPKYYQKTTEQKVELTVPDVTSGSVKIKIILRGGEASVHNMPREVTAQHNYAIIRAVQENDEDSIFPSSYQVFSNVSGGSNTQKEFDYEFHDQDPYNSVSFYNYSVNSSQEGDGMPTAKWQPGNKSLIVLLNELKIKFNRYNTNGYDITFNPGVDVRFYNLLRIDFDGNGNKLFLPVYEERKMLADTKRFILFEHEESSSTVTHIEEYVFSDK